MDAAAVLAHGSPQRGGQLDADLDERNLISDLILVVFCAFWLLAFGRNVRFVYKAIRTPFLEYERFVECCL